MAVITVDGGAAVLNNKDCAGLAICAVCTKLRHWLFSHSERVATLAIKDLIQGSPNVPHSSSNDETAERNIQMPE